MVIDIGGGTVDMGIVSLGGIVDSKTIRFGGSDINNALLRYVRWSVLGLSFLKKL